MPYVLTNQEDEDQKKQSANVAGTDATGDVGAGGAQGSTLLSPQQSGVSGFTDVKAYLDANKDQAAGMAQNIGGKLNQEANDLENTIGSGEKDFEKTVDQNKVDFDPDTVKSALADPTSFVKDDANVDKFTKMRDASYAGPSSLYDTNQYGDLQNKISDGERRAKLTDTDAGRQELLFETGQNPTKGQVTLDSLILSGSPETRDILKNQTAKFGTLANYLDTQNQNASAYASNAKAASNATGSMTKDLINKAVPQFQHDIASRVDQARQTAAQRATAAKTALASKNTGTYDPQQLADLGLSNDEMNALQSGRAILDKYNNLIDPVTNKPYYAGGFDPTQFATEKNPENEITTSNVATDADYAKAAALGKLSGQNLAGILNPADAASAGKANLDTYDFDKAGALGSMNSLIRDRDAYILQQTNGIDLNDPDAFAKSGMQDYFDAILNGKVGASSNPVRDAQQRMAIQAAVRQGIYTPKPLVTDPGTGTQTIGPVAHI